MITAGASRVQVTRDDAQVAVVRLAAGQVGVRVPRLPPGGRLEVITPDARVQVKGTRFKVRRVGGGRTQVQVTEGTVWVTPTGRNRQTHVLRVGQSATVLGEAAYLQQLSRELSEALAAGRLAEVVRLGRRYLAVTSRPARASAVRLRLAGALSRLGETRAAIAIYRRVATRAPQPVARQNALAFLARLHEGRGQTAEAHRVWQQLSQRFPGGLYERTALARLVRWRCGKTDASAQGWRRRLARYAPTHAATRALLTRCAPQEARHAK